mgnify:CR=1 FL=1|jgi:hypothetical protein
MLVLRSGRCLIAGNARSIRWMPSGGAKVKDNNDDTIIL